MKTPNEVKSWVDMLLSRRPNVEDRNYLETIKVYMDKVDRPTGHWIEETSKLPRCSECGTYSDDADREGGGFYCTHCGAKMIEVQHEN